MHFSIVVVDHPTDGYVQFFDDSILPIFFGLRRLGYQAEILRHRINPHSRNIIVGSVHDPGLGGLNPPQDSIVLNVEQLLAENNPHIGPAYWEHLKQFVIWDFSQRNVRRLAEQGIKADHLALGYIPEMTRLADYSSPGYDLLFYGLANARRLPILERLRKDGLKVNQSFARIFGRERDAAIRDSRLYLNIHQFFPVALEVVRLGYLWANKMPIVSELRPDTEMYPGLEEACLYCDYEELAEKTKELLADEKKLRAQGQAGFEAFSALSLEKSLEKLVGRRVIYGPGHRFYDPLPKRLNAGSGRDFRNDSLNIDQNPICNPDLVWDVSLPLEPGAKYQTERFGEIGLEAGRFEVITAFDLLEHVGDLPQTMRNFLELLEVGGRLIASVPYDLSLGAWQDPTHVRGLNENSWLYFTEWAWYLGWTEECFEMDELSYVLSKMGTKAAGRGAGPEKLIRTPRMVDSMYVVLRKRRITEKEKQFQRRMFRSLYDRTQVTWNAVQVDHRDISDFEREKREVFSGNGTYRQARLRAALANAHYYLYKFLSIFGLGHKRREQLKVRRNHLRRLVLPDHLYIKVKRS